jgi:hypothetical protein
VFIKALYIGLVISVIAVVGVVGALYARVRKHLGKTEEHAPEHEMPPGKQ